MDLNWKINLINQMIKENPEYTIRDYFNMLDDIKQIKPEEDMNKPILYTAEDAEFMIKNCREFTVRQLSQKLGIPESTVRNFGSRYKLTFRSMPIPGPIAKAKIVSSDAEKRPEASYSNTGFISATQKYAS